jgi:hypothetical protein
MGGDALADEALALFDAEFVLFVDDGEAEAGEFGVAVEEGMGADENLGAGLADGEEGVEAVFFSGRSAEAEAQAEREWGAREAEGGGPTAGEKQLRPRPLRLPRPRAPSSRAPARARPARTSTKAARRARSGGVSSA